MTTGTRVTHKEQSGVFYIKSVNNDGTYDIKQVPISRKFAKYIKNVQPSSLQKIEE